MKKSGERIEFAKNMIDFAGVHKKCHSGNRMALGGKKECQLSVPEDEESEPLSDDGSEDPESEDESDELEESEESEFSFPEDESSVCSERPTLQPGQSPGPSFLYPHLGQTYSFDSALFAESSFFSSSSTLLEESEDG